MKKLVKVLFSLPIIISILALFINPAQAAANLQFVRAQVCYNGKILLNPPDYPSGYCTNNLYDAYWRFRYRINNTGNQVGYATVCYSDFTAGSGNSMRESNCLYTHNITIKPGSFVDVNDSAPLALCRWGFLGIHPKGSPTYPYYFISDREWLSLSTPCPR